MLSLICSRPPGNSPSPNEAGFWLKSGSPDRLTTVAEAGLGFGTQGPEETILFHAASLARV